MSSISIYERVKAWNINWRSVFFVGVFVALFLEFYLNFFGTVSESAFSSFQNGSEDLVLRRIEASLEAGIFSFGGFLIGSNGGTYTSQFGLHGDIFGLIAQLLQILDITTIFSLFRGISAALTALVITLIIRWLSDEFEFKGWLLLVLPVFIILGVPLIPYSYQFIGMARNLYWIPFTFFLPILIMISLNKNKSNMKSYSLLGLGLLFFSVFGKCLCGFEYISTILIAGSVPLFYYAVKDRMRIQTFIIRFFQYALATLSGFIVSVGLYCLKLYLYIGEWSLVFAKLMDSIAKRTYGFDVGVADVYAQSLTTPLNEVINIYLVPQIKLFLVILTIIAGYIIIIHLLNTRHLVHPSFVILHENTNRKLLAGLCATGISFLAPLSWVILAKGHSYIHVHMNYCLWWIPFIMMGLAFGIYFINCLVNSLGLVDTAKTHVFIQKKEVGLALILISLGVVYFVIIHLILTYFVHLNLISNHVVIDSWIINPILIIALMIGCSLFGIILLLHEKFHKYGDNEVVIK